MNNHNEIIFQNLIRNKFYSHLEIDDIIDDKNFNSKQYESICLNMYRSFMCRFIPENLIHIRLLNCQSINGMACLINKNYYSLIHWGTIYNLHKYALLLTEKPSFFPNISLLNGKWDIISENTISKEDKDKETFYTKIYPFGTNDQYRRDLAFLIAFFAWSTTVFHEAGHIINGHLDYRHHTFHESSFPILFTNAEYQNNLTIKALEKDADEFASNRIIDYAFHTNRDLFFNDYSHIINSEKTLIELIICGITLKFLLFGINPYLPNPYYLPTAYRIINIADSAFHHLNAMGYSSISKETFHKIAQTSITNMITSYNLIFSSPINIPDFINQMMYGKIENISLKKEWNRLYPILNMYKNPNVVLAPPFDDI